MKDFAENLNVEFPEDVTAEAASLLMAGRHVDNGNVSRWNPRDEVIQAEPIAKMLAGIPGAIRSVWGWCLPEGSSSTEPANAVRKGRVVYAIVLSGEVWFQSGGEQFALDSGTVWVLNRGVEYTSQNVGDSPACYITVEALPPEATVDPEIEPYVHLECCDLDEDCVCRDED